MTKFLLFVFLSFFLISASCEEKKSNYISTEYCKTKYPIVLVHGFALRDDNYLLKYWGDIPGVLKKNGAEVFLVKHDSFAPIEKNAEKLWEKIKFVLKKTGAKKVNLIGHSKGGLESRYLVSSLKKENFIASVTTICTPHRGSYIADYFLKERKFINKFNAKLINKFALLLGDENPDAIKAVKQLSPSEMKKFNKINRDSKKVYYQSYAANIDKHYDSLIWVKLFKILSRKEGKNDGLVSIDSAKWANFKGVIGEKSGINMSHGSVVGIYLPGEKDRFDEDHFFIKLVNELKRKGF